MINALTFYTQADLHAAGISHAEFVLLRMAGLRGMKRSQGGAVAWYDGSEVQRYQRIVNNQPTKPPKGESVKKKSKFAKQSKAFPTA